MIAKLAGAFLLAVGGGCICAERIIKRRKEIRRLRELADALENMEAMIRWEKATLPLAVKRQAGRKECGEMFSRVLEQLESGETLQLAWEKTFCQNILESLCQIEFWGDEKRITGQLHMAAQQLRQSAEQYSAARAENEKLSVAICASAVGLVTILLF